MADPNLSSKDAEQSSVQSDAGLGSKAAKRSSDHAFAHAEVELSAGVLALLACTSNPIRGSRLAT
jgi:hypothetical protein